MNCGMCLGHMALGEGCWEGGPCPDKERHGSAVWGSSCVVTAVLCPVIV